MKINSFRGKILSLYRLPMPFSCYVQKSFIITNEKKTPSSWEQEKNNNIVEISRADKSEADIDLVRAKTSKKTSYICQRIS